MKTAILTGPTATGKTAVALEFCRKHGNIEIINADSILIYRGMDIGSAKPTHEERKEITHHLIDLMECDHEFNAGDFVRLCSTTLEECHQRGKRALIVGGTGFYLKALIYGMWEASAIDHDFRKTLEEQTTETLFERLKAIDPRANLKITPHDRYRIIRALEVHHTTGKSTSDMEENRNKIPNPDYELLIIDREDQELFSRLSKRTHEMVQTGWIEETVALYKKFPKSRALQAVGYRQIIDYHIEKKTPSGRKMKPGIRGLEDEIVLATRQLVKRQRTWFKGQFLSKQFILDRQKDLLFSELKALYN